MDTNITQEQKKKLLTKINHKIIAVSRAITNRPLHVICIFLKFIQYLTICLLCHRPLLHLSIISNSAPVFVKATYKTKIIKKKLNQDGKENGPRSIFR